MHKSELNNIYLNSTIVHVSINTHQTIEVNVQDLLVCFVLKTPVSLVALTCRKFRCIISVVNSALSTAKSSITTFNCTQTHIPNRQARGDQS